MVSDLAIKIPSLRFVRLKSSFNAQVSDLKPSKVVKGFQTGIEDVASFLVDRVFQLVEEDGLKSVDCSRDIGVVNVALMLVEVLADTMIAGIGVPVRKFRVVVKDQTIVLQELKLGFAPADVRKIERFLF